MLNFLLLPFLPYMIRQLTIHINVLEKYVKKGEQRGGWEDNKRAKLIQRCQYTEITGQILSQQPSHFIEVKHTLDHRKREGDVTT